MNPGVEDDPLVAPYSTGAIQALSLSNVTMQCDRIWRQVLTTSLGVRVWRCLHTIRLSRSVFLLFSFLAFLLEKSG